MTVKAIFHSSQKTTHSSLRVLASHQKELTTRKQAQPGESAEQSQVVPNDAQDPLANVNNDSTQSHEQTEKRLRNLKKKLQQIEKLKAKQYEGEALEELQIAKIGTEEAVLKEINELQELLEQM